MPIFDAWYGTSAPDGTRRELRFRGDGHYARPEAMTWCENNGIDYIFGLSGTKPLVRKVDEVADDIRTPTRHREPACSARLYRDAPQGKVLGSRTAHRRPY
ncbi:hypothetical protein ACVWZZ_004440 [Bradyrhizobium sp. LM6.10]